MTEPSMFPPSRRSVAFTSFCVGESVELCPLACTLALKLTSASCPHSGHHHRDLRSHSVDEIIFNNLLDTLAMPYPSVCRT